MDAFRRSGCRRFSMAEISATQILFRWCLMGSVGCFGCYRPAVVPPSASIGRPAVPVSPALVTPVPLVPEVSPFAPIGRDNLWIPEAELRSWKYLVLHHTASERGDVESIHESHLRNKDKNGNPWLGIGYHFVIGNGQGMGDGEIASTFRWREQLQGAHAGVKDYNQYGIGIVLIGNFKDRSPTPGQVTSLKRLVRVLSREYGIRTSQIIGHGEVKPTECPGIHFPLKEIRESVTGLE